MRIAGSGLLKMPMQMIRSDHHEDDGQNKVHGI